MSVIYKGTKVGVTLGDGGGGGIPVVAKADWDSLSAAQKQAYGLVAVQEYTDGYFEGKLFNGADFTTQPTLIASKLMNGASNSVLQHTFSSGGEFTLILALPHGKPIANLALTLNNSDISNEFTQLFYASTVNMNAYGLRRAFSSGDVISLSNSASDANTGVQLFVFDHVLVENIRLIGSKNNNGESFIIPPSDYAWYFEVAKFGYYQGANTTPATRVFQSPSGGSSTPCPNQSAYYYGGTYVVTLL